MSFTLETKWVNDPLKFPECSELSLQYREIWKDVRGFEDYYEISSKGNVRSKSRVVVTKKGVNRKLDSKIRVPVKTKGYYSITFSKNHKWSKFQIHRLVAKAFIPNPENKPCVNHINGNKLDNKVENLEWCTYKENEKHSYEKLGKVSPNKKLTYKDYNSIKLEVNKVDSNKKEIAKKFNISLTHLYRIINDFYV